MIFTMLKKINNAVLNESSIRRDLTFSVKKWLWYRKRMKYFFCNHSVLVVHNVSGLKVVNKLGSRCLSSLPFYNKIRQTCITINQVVLDVIPNTIFLRNGVQLLDQEVVKICSITTWSGNSKHLVKKIIIKWIWLNVVIIILSFSSAIS